MYRKTLSAALIIMLTVIWTLQPHTSISQEAETYTIAVLDLTANGISLTEAASLSDYLRGQIARVITSDEYVKLTNVTYTIVERGQMDKIFEEFDVQNTGCTDISCAVEFGKMLNAERIIIGSVGLVGQTYTISTRIVDVESGITKSFADYLFTGKRDNLLREGIPSIVNELMYGKKQKKSRKIYYIVGGAIIAGGVLAAVLGSSPGGDDAKDNTGTITFTIPDPSE